jgi:hypothetical protein
MKEVLAKNGRASCVVARLSADTEAACRATSVRAVVSGQINTALRVAAGRARCASGRCDARIRTRVATLRLSAHLGLPRAEWTYDERRSCTSAVAGCMGFECRE